MVKKKGTKMRVLNRFTLAGIVVLAGGFQVVFGASAESERGAVATAFGARQ